MIITHTQRKEGGRWKPYTGVCDWEKKEFTGLIDDSHAYKFDNGDIWDKVGGWRDPMGWSNIPCKTYSKKDLQKVWNTPEKTTDDIYNFINHVADIPQTMRGVVAHYEPTSVLWPDRHGGVRPREPLDNASVKSTQVVYDDYEDDYKFEFTSNKKENLCSRHLWQ